MGGIGFSNVAFSCERKGKKMTGRLKETSSFLIDIKEMEERRKVSPQKKCINVNASCQASRSRTSAAFEE